MVIAGISLKKKDKFAGSNTELKFKLCYSVEQILLYNVPK